MALVYLDDIRLNAEVSGPVGGPGVLLLHALGTDLTIWDEVVALLPPGLRVLRFDQRGHGKSDVPAAPYAMGGADPRCRADADAFRHERGGRGRAVAWAGWWRRGWR